MKGSLMNQNLIFHFVSVLTDGLRMMLPKRLFQLGQKWLKFLISGKDCLNPNNLVKGDLGKKSYEFLLFQMNGPLVPAKLHFPEQMPKKLNNFLVTFQTSSPKVLFIFDSLKNQVCSFDEKFILPDVSKKASYIWPIQIQKWELMK